VEIKIKGSRFIANAGPADTKGTALDFLDSLKAKYHNATHNCYAYRIGKDGLNYRAVDDGEPAGSAGKPILFSITKHNLSDIIVVVTRYFGGTKLGVGGLSRAYGEITNNVLDICKIQPVYITVNLKVFCTYEDLDDVKKIIHEFAVSFDENYQDAIEFNVQIPISQVENFKIGIISQTSGRAGVLEERR
jgi:uncharacterized YigZ family protein